ncbi:hypothetical protein NE562_12150 [Butyricicoccus faecihominis]|uniref:hypothetical protein n=1 Tax=Butyricicoccus faecihominis TaxID=1712515 RepID=UPI0024789ED1|nr:hypothetical protein [Butyricicoccus faecihominis]MCQ5130415.1 hypothetical protein [Butyricicoccus faecihominis]
MINVHGSGLPQSNSNLLINPWFQINQRGQSTYSGHAYTVDRWRLVQDGGTLTTRTDGIDTVTLNNSWFSQGLEMSGIAGQTVTLSLECENVTTDGMYLTDSGATAETHRDIRIRNGINTYTFTVSDVLHGVFVWGTGSFRPLRAKLELGPVSTLAYDSPPDPATELLKCQRYYEVISSETLHTAGYHPKTLYGVDNNKCLVMQPWKATKRTTPTVIVNGATEGQHVNFRCSQDNSRAEGSLVSWNESYLGGRTSIEISDIVSEFQPGKIYEATIIGDAEIY